MFLQITVFIGFPQIWGMQEDEGTDEANALEVRTNFSNKENYLISKVNSFIALEWVVSEACVLNCLSLDVILSSEHCECELFQHNKKSLHG